MLSRLFRYIEGYLRIRVEGYFAERFLNACRYRGIYLWGLRSVPGAYEMNITIRGFKELKPIIRKTGTKVVILKKFGLPFYLYRYRKRKIFFAGAFLFVFLVFWMSMYIWNIDITGNHARTDETILSFLKTRSVENGMPKSKVDCQRIVKDIRKEYDDVIWVSASVKGTRLMIKIRENEDSKDITASQDSKSEYEFPKDIIADRDCLLESAIVRKGVLTAKIGEKVKKGDVLVSGQVPVNNDAGEATAYQYHISDADLIGRTSLKYEDSYDHMYIEKKDVSIQKEEYWVRFGKIRIGLGGIKNQYEHFTMRSEEWQLKLFENFFFPVSWGVRRVTPYEPVEKVYSQREIQEILTERFQRHCKDLEKKGVEIIQNDVKIYTGSKSSLAKGKITVRMPVGKLKESELFKIPKTDEESTKMETGE